MCPAVDCAQALHYKLIKNKNIYNCERILKEHKQLSHSKLCENCIFIYLKEYK